MRTFREFELNWDSRDEWPFPRVSCVCVCVCVYAHGAHWDRGLSQYCTVRTRSLESGLSDACRRACRLAIDGGGSRSPLVAPPHAAAALAVMAPTDVKLKLRRRLHAICMHACMHARGGVSLVTVA